MPVASDMCHVVVRFFQPPCPVKEHKTHYGIVVQCAAMKRRLDSKGKMLFCKDPRPSLTGGGHHDDGTLDPGVPCPACKHYIVDFNWTAKKEEWLEDVPRLPPLPPKSASTPGGASHGGYVHQIDRDSDADVLSAMDSVQSQDPNDEPPNQDFHGQQQVNVPVGLQLRRRAP